MVKYLRRGEIMKLLESQTLKNLAQAYAGECQAQTRYKFIEYGARLNGYKTLAEIIDRLVYNEFNHARMFYTFIQQASKQTIDNIDISSGYPFKEKWDLEENLRLAYEDELMEVQSIYPTYARIAKEEGFDEIAKLFEDVISVEKMHAKTLKELYEQFSKQTLYSKKEKVLWKCGDCGYEEFGQECWDECPLCKAKQGSAYLHLKI